MKGRSYCDFTKRLRQNTPVNHKVQSNIKQFLIFSYCQIKEIYIYIYYLQIIIVSIDLNEYDITCTF